MDKQHDSIVENSPPPITAAHCFALTSVWRIPAPIEKVWEALIVSEHWPEWWKYVNSVEELAAGNEKGINNIRRYNWHTCLPYQLTMELCTTRLIPLTLIETAVNGDLKGTGSCYLSHQNDITTLHYQWNVCLNKSWMKWVSPIVHPIFVWNHQRVMKQGEQSLCSRLSSG